MDPDADSYDAQPAEPTPAPTPWVDTKEIARLELAVKRLVEAAHADEQAWPMLAHLTDRYPHRLSGSKGLADSIQWSYEQLKAAGLDVQLQPVEVRNWVRGAERVTMVAPVTKPLAALGLGGTVPTPKRGLRAPLLVVTSWDDLEAKRAQAKGAIVLFNVPMSESEEHHGYGEVVDYRWSGASRAAAHGAVGMLMRSVTTRSLVTPHTGSLGYDPKHPKIPAAAISTEDADHLAREFARGPVTVEMNLQSQELPPARSHNVIAELRGSEAPNEIVLISAHIDSWDVGQGAHDDGGSVVACMRALALLKKLGITPRRTIRAVLFTNEENGLAGGKTYAAEAVKAGALAAHVLAFEADLGTFEPTGYQFLLANSHAHVLARLEQLAPLWRLAGAPTIRKGWAGADVQPLTSQGVLGASLTSKSERYFDYHHTHADTLDKVRPEDLRGNVAAIAVLAYVIADLPSRIDQP